jgi:predicted NUDIX family phosphoesterase
MSKINILEEHAIAAKESILVIPDSVVNNFEGFKKVSSEEIISIINEFGRYEYRNDELEANESLRQIIPYVAVLYRNPNGESLYLAGERTSKTGDQRLVGETFIGFGGHVGANDVEDKDFLEWQKREIEEELDLQGNISKQEFLGLIRHTNLPVSRVHLGLVFRIEVDNPNIESKEDKISNLKMYSVDELHKLIINGSIETWSKEIIDANIL